MPRTAAPLSGARGSGAVGAGTLLAEEAGELAHLDRRLDRLDVLARVEVEDLDELLAVRAAHREVEPVGLDARDVRVEGLDDLGQRVLRIAADRREGLGRRSGVEQVEEGRKVLGLEA